MTLRLDTLPLDHWLRNTPLRNLDVHYKHSKATRRKVLPTFAIASCTFNELSDAWTNRYEWTVELPESELDLS